MHQILLVRDLSCCRRLLGGFDLTLVILKRIAFLGGRVVHAPNLPAMKYLLLIHRLSNVYTHLCQPPLLGKALLLYCASVNTPVAIDISRERLQTKLPRTVVDGKEKLPSTMGVIICGYTCQAHLFGSSSHSMSASSLLDSWVVAS